MADSRPIPDQPTSGDAPRSADSRRMPPAQEGWVRCPDCYDEFLRIDWEVEEMTVTNDGMVVCRLCAKVRKG